MIRHLGHLHEIALSAIRAVIHPPMSLKEVHSYWTDPTDGSHAPSDYTQFINRSQFLAFLLRTHSSSRHNILEIGSNVGRNLNFLFNDGYTDLTAIEISPAALEQFAIIYPDAARHTVTYNAPIESIIKGFHDSQFNTVFTMAVLMHIHPNSEWIFPEIARITGHLLVTIEAEARDRFSFPSTRTFPRNYRKVFEPLGMRQIASIACNHEIGFVPGVIARVFASRSGTEGGTS